MNSNIETQPLDLAMSANQLCICGDPTCTVPYGYCHCLCGNRTTIATRTWINVNAKVGWPLTFVNGHQRRIRPHYEDESPFYIDGEPCRWIVDSAGNKYIVDSNRFPELSKWQWFPCRAGMTNRKIDNRKSYAVRRERINGKDRSIALHDEVLNPPLGYTADHKNRNPFDNRLSNLRPATRIQQLWNTAPHCDKKTSEYKGVSRKGGRGTYRVDIRYYSVAIVMYYSEEMDAAIAYDIAASELFGEFAWLNFPDRIVDPPWADDVKRKCCEAKIRVGV